MVILNNKEKIKNKGISFLKSNKQGSYILGTNKYGIAVKNLLHSSNIPVLGFINDFLVTDSFDNIPVIKLEEIKEGSSFINCIVEGRVVIAHNNIEKKSPASHVDYFALQLAFPDALPEPEFLDNTDSVLNLTDAYMNLFDMMADDESKKTLERVTNFRLNREIMHMASFEFKIDKQYFEPFLQLPKHPVFIDGGGFDGFTTQEFIRKNPDYKHVYYFEPTAKSLSIAQQNLSSQKFISYFEKGLWDKTETLLFDNSKTSANSIQENGSISISVCALDEVVHEPVHFIKLDIEGAEMKALHGAKKIITAFKPAIAVCVYHRQSDFIEIPSFLKAIHPSYKIYLRHYTQGVFETVMYFI